MAGQSPAIHVLIRACLKT